MTLFSPTDLSFVKAVGCLCYTNPFLQERIELEHQALGSDYRNTQQVWSLRKGESNQNLEALGARSGQIVNLAFERLKSGNKPSAEELGLYQDLVRYYLFYLFEDDFLSLAHASLSESLIKHRVDFYTRFAQEAKKLYGPITPPVELATHIAHLFACQFQVRRAFFLVYENILGASAAAASLRAAVWQSIFTHDEKRYYRALFDRMHEIPTLVTGPSGTGKELVARAIGLSRYVPFNPNTRQFTQETGGAFFSLNVSALAPTVVESELFGHKRGAFTGAVQDRTGWFELTASSGTIFLDEIGELDPSIQVKLLRVLQTRQFQRVGDTRTESFSGKLITATSRDLAHEMRRGNFREDFYYRLCADVVVTPSLQQQLSENPDDLNQLVSHALERIVDEQEVLEASGDVVDWIRNNLGTDYAWPGNVRELEQCVRSVIVRKSYRPAAATGQSTDSFEDFMRAVAEGLLTADQLLNAYCKLVYAKTKSYQETSRRLGLDRRTVKGRVWK